MGLSALVLAAAATLAFRHQRFHRDVVVAVERAEQLDQMVALLPISLRGIAPGEGDIPPGGARDTALEFRATIATAALCDGDSTAVILAPAGATPRLASVLTRPEAGDTAWILDTSAATERWVARRIAGVSDTSLACAVGGSLPFGSARRTSMVLRLATPRPAGSAARVTRPWRYSIYLASDGQWFIGAKDWNPGLSRFNTIQPVAGPLRSASAGGLRFRYLDQAGSVVPAATGETKRIAVIEVSLSIDSTHPGGKAAGPSIRSRATVVIGLRNRMR